MAFSFRVPRQLMDFFRDYKEIQRYFLDLQEKVEEVSILAGSNTTLLVDGILVDDTITSLYEEPTNKETAITEIIFCNTDTTERIGIDMYFTTSGEPAQPKNQILTSSGWILSPNETRTFCMNQEIQEGGKIQAKATVPAKVSIRISGGQTDV